MDDAKILYLSDFFKVYFWQFYLYDRTDQYWQETKWERDRGGIRKGPWVEIRTRDARSATALYVGALPTRLSASTYLSEFIKNKTKNIQ